jgi:hypothetical protein
VRRVDFRAKGIYKVHPQVSFFAIFKKGVGMTRVLFVSVLLLLLSLLTLPVVTGADEDGPSANGSFQIILENGRSREVNFNARLASDGSTTGEIIFRDAVSATDPKLAGTKLAANENASEASNAAKATNANEVANATTASNSSESASGSGSAPPFYAKAVCDCLMIKGVEAVLSGTITEASLENYVGRRVLLVVQDGDSLTPPLRDKLTFGFYKTITKNWLATDGERADDGPAPAWVATDAERPDDVGTLSQKSEQVTCESFPISAHSFIGSKQGRGKIEVRR